MKDIIFLTTVVKPSQEVDDALKFCIAEQIFFYELSFMESFVCFIESHETFNPENTETSYRYYSKCSKALKKVRQYRDDALTDKNVLELYQANFTI